MTKKKNASCWIENCIGINNLFSRTRTPRVRSLQSLGEYQGNRRNRQNWIKFLLTNSEGYSYDGTKKYKRLRFV